MTHVFSVPCPQLAFNPFRPMFTTLRVQVLNNQCISPKPLLELLLHKVPHYWVHEPLGQDNSLHFYEVMILLGDVGSRPPA